MNVTTKSQFAKLLAEGRFRRHTGDPWIRFNEMIEKYGDDSAIIVSDHFLTYATMEYFKGEGNAEEITEDIQQES